MLTSFTTQKITRCAGSAGSPAAPHRPITQAKDLGSFANLVAEAWPKLAEARNSRDYALDCGIDEQALEAYASGACSLYERKAVERLISKCQWAMTYLTDLVKSRRSSD